MIKILCILLLLIFPNSLFAYDMDLNTGLVAPGTCTNVDDFTNPDNAKISDDAYADGYNAFVGKPTLRCSNFGFTIPTGATIDSVLVYVEGHGGDGASCQLLDATGAITGDKVAYSLPTHDDSEVTVRGTTNELWNATWTAADINDSDFGVQLTCLGGTHLYIDLVRIQIYYSTYPSGNTGLVAPGTCTNVADFPNPDNAKVSDDVYTKGYGLLIPSLDCQNFGFTIPAGATIEFVFVYVEGYGGTNESCKLLNASGDVVGETVSFEAGASDNDTDVRVRGTTNELWNATWTAADINDSDFGVRVATGASDTLFVDLVRMQIYYDPPHSGGQIIMITGD